VWELEHKITQLIGKKGKLEKQLEVTKAISSHKEEVERSFKAKNDKLRLEVSIAEEKCSKFEAEVERLKKELGALAEAKEAAAKEFNDERAKIMLESEDLRRRLEEIQAIKDLAESENDKLRSEALIAKEKQNMSEAEIRGETPQDGLGCIDGGEGDSCEVIRRREGQIDEGSREPQEEDRGNPRQQGSRCGSRAQQRCRG
jgi:chromosome segregation ATPase